MKKKGDAFVDLARNKKAFHLYEIVNRYEAGISLQGTEVKSCRDHKISFKDSYAEIKGDELYLRNLHISPYKHGTLYNHEPERPRKLLLHKREIMKLKGQVSQKGFTLIPLRVYLKEYLIKVELGLGRGKRQYEKRDDIKQREARVDMDRGMSRSLKSKM